MDIQVPPWKLTYPLKNDGWFRCISYWKGSLFRGHSFVFWGVLRKNQMMKKPWPNLIPHRSRSLGHWKFQTNSSLVSWGMPWLPLSQAGKPWNFWGFKVPPRSSHPLTVDGSEIPNNHGWFVFSPDFSEGRISEGFRTEKKGVLKSEKLPLWSQHVTILLKWWRTFWMIKLGNLEHSGRCLPRIATW